MLGNWSDRSVCCYGEAVWNGDLLMGTDIDNVIEDANALLEHINYWIVCRGTENRNILSIKKIADDLILALMEQKECEQ